ncbi:NDP-hexose 2,3-dehydratase family protein [Streptomyces virginiae]|uniref:NDP-hexose 2,3-dehydratase family protein n=1 Tax=Streptomyces virginiae TaxID=1961 RepID=UPI00224C9D47|nr:NDP-hexose 2,3-dehydratase family protein [Streptomyces virginiae]MCX4957484.1 NDP-hexose 2,3-dehydratase family protein [Streptomyces virginiae]MCX5176226.1 NDP-hexose 2,3-dehydratase family protein [Streptomyces virginiae]
MTTLTALPELKPRLTAVTVSPLLKPRTDPDLSVRLARSAAARSGSHLATADFADWLSERREAHQFRIERVPLEQLDGWSFDPDTGNLGHHSGRFFTVEGLHVTTDDHSRQEEWYQPVIKQPEVGILGILVKEFDGVLHCLMQAKMEPGNPNLLQLSPTVQATRSNYTKVHKGADVKYLEYFTDPSRSRVVADVLQSEHGSWFFHKSNRNMIVEAVGEVAEDPDFCWLTLGQIGELLLLDNVVNMDSRTVLACVPPESGAAGTGGLHTDTEVRSWFTAERSRHDVTAERIPLASLPDWVRGESTVSHRLGRYFDVVGVNVYAGSREVTSWSQPLFEPVGRGVAAFLCRDIGGVPHVLVHARVEGGFLDTVELGPTVQYTPGNYAHLRGEQRPRFLDDVLAADPERIRYEAVHAEEGGRFLNAEARYMVVDTDQTEEPPGYLWVTPGQLSTLVQHSHYVNVQARTLIACLNAISLEGAAPAAQASQASGGAGSRATAVLEETGGLSR